MRYLINFFLLLITLSSGYTASALSLSEIRETLAVSQVLKTEFLQEKYLSSLDRTLKSSGTLTVVGSENIIWRQKLPFQLDLVITGDALVQNMNGEKTVLTRKDNPQMFDISRLMMNIFAVNGQIENHFAVQSSGTLENWKIILTPQDEMLDKVFRTITLEGDRNINTIIIADQSGDLTTIHLTNTEHNALLTAEDKACLE